MISRPLTILSSKSTIRESILRKIRLKFDIVPSDMLFALSALEYGLAQHGHKFSTGSGVSAAQKLILENAKRRI